MRSAKRKFCFIGSLILLFVLHSAQAQDIRYFYDDLGRLIGVVDEQGNAAEYVYDEVGNILEIRRTNVADFPGPVAITFFNPDRGEVGTEVTIFGTGFSPTPSQNQVSFNGTSAPVTASTDQTITTEVPAGATTGPISVTTPLGSAVSQEPFTVVTDVAISPTEATVFVGFPLQFTANVQVIWRVNNIDGGNATFGTITTGGVYQAPGAIPTDSTVTVTAVNQQDTRLFASAPVTIVSSPERLLAKPVSLGFPPPVPSVSPLLGPLVSVGVTPPSAGATLLLADLTSLAKAPLITATIPSSGAQGITNLGVTFEGAGFIGATGVQFLLNGSPDVNISVTGLSVSPDGTQATATVSVGLQAALGVRTVTISTPDGTSSPLGIGGNVFEVTSP